MMIPAAYGAAVYQFNVVIITLLASFLPSGSVSYLWYADRIVEFPIGIFAIAMATALLPSLSDHAADQKMEEFRVVFRQALRSTFFIIVPSTVGLIVLARPIVSVLFERGSFDSVTAAESASTLVFYALGLPFISGVRIVSNAFFSLKDTHTPVRCANVSVIVNIAAALLLMGPMRHEGLALAVSLAACANFLLQIRSLRKKLGPLGLRSVGRDLARSVVASLVMSVVVWWLGSQGSGPTGPMGLAVQITAGASTYLLTAWVLRSPEAVQIGSRLASLWKGGGRRDGLHRGEGPGAPSP
jgi:putative peptidoglycan lipid II flippase